MKVRQSREVMIEIERVQVIRKRARTRMIYCGRCRAQTDSISINKAATLLNTGRELLLKFINDTGSHYQTEPGGKILICLKSLIIRMDEIKSDRVKQLPLKQLNKKT